MRNVKHSFPRFSKDSFLGGQTSPLSGNSCLLKDNWKIIGFVPFANSWVNIMHPRNSPNLVTDCLRPFYHSDTAFIDWLISTAGATVVYRGDKRFQLCHLLFSSSVTLKLDFFSQVILHISLKCWTNDVPS